MGKPQGIELFRFDRDGCLKLNDVVCWRIYMTRTARNGCATTGLLVACVLLWQLASTENWRLAELVFGKHKSQLSEIFCKALTCFMELRGCLIKGCITSGYIMNRVAHFASAIQLSVIALIIALGLWMEPSNRFSGQPTIFFSAL